MPYSDSVVGAAIFDLNGLPKEYFTTPEDDNMSWVQTIFQALGLRSLLMSSLQLEAFITQPFLAPITQQWLSSKELTISRC